MRCYRVSEKLPADGQWVLAFFPDMPWVERAGGDDHLWSVVKFIRGLSIEDREALPDGDRRKKTIMRGDEWSNNRRPYEWKTFGPMAFFGQEALVWCELPQLGE